MEVFVQGIHPTALISIFFLLVGSFGTLLFYGVWLCCGSRSSLLSMADKKRTFFKHAYMWKNSLLEEVSVIDREHFDESDWELLGTNSNIEDHSCVHQSSTASGRLKTDVSDEEIRNASSPAGQKLNGNFENNIVTYIKDRFMRFHRVSQWVRGHKKMLQTPSTSEKLKDIEESSIDCLINRLDSLVLSFHSSECSTSTGIETLSEDDFVFSPEFSCQKDHHTIIVDSKSECCDYFYPVSASELRDWNQSH